MNLQICGVIALAVVVGAMVGCREPNAPAAPSPGPAATVVIEQSGSPAAAAAQAISTLCNIESIDGTAFATRSVSVAKPVRIVGWLGSDSGTAPQAPMLRIADKHTKAVIRDYPLQLVVERPDVVQAFPGKPGLQHSGFEVVLDPQGLVAGAGHLYLVYQDGGAGFLCDNGRQVDIVR